MTKGNAVVGMDWANYGAWPYAINMLKQSFSQQAPAAPSSFAWTQELDQYGYPNVTRPTYRIDNYFQSWQTVNGYSGRYVLKWDGKAGQTTLSIGATAIYNANIGTITRSGGDVVFYGTDGYVEFDVNGSVLNAIIHFETTGTGTWDGTCRNMRVFRLDDAADEAAGKLVRQEVIDKIQSLGVRAMRFMDPNAVNNGCQALWQYRRKVTDFDWFGSVRIPAGTYVGAISGTTTYTSNVAPDNSSNTLVDGQISYGIVTNQQASQTQATYQEGSKAAKGVVYIGGGSSNGASGATYDTIRAGINPFQYNAILDSYIWTATNFQSGFGMTESMPYEVCAEICVRAGIDCYICLPTLYTQASHQSLGALMGSLLAGTGLTCYVELGNELWNGQFGQAGMMSSMATALGFKAAAPANGDVNLARFSTQGLLHRRAMESFATGWTSSGASMSYLKRILAVQNFGSIAALKTYCFEGVQLSSYGYDVAGNRPIDYTDLVVTAPYIFGGTMVAGYHWDVATMSSSMLTDVTTAADANTSTGIAYVDAQMRAGNTIGGSTDTNSLTYCVPTQMALWANAVSSYNTVSRTSPLRVGCYEGGTEIYWPNVDQCTSLEISPSYGTGTGSSIGAWAANSQVSAGYVRSSASKAYKATSSGYTGNTAPTHSSGTVSDGAITWKYIGADTLNVGTVGGDKIKTMVMAWRNSSTATAFLQDYYAALNLLPGMTLPGQYVHLTTLAGGNWGNQFGFYSSDSGLTTGLKNSNLTPRRLVRANGGSASTALPQQANLTAWWAAEDVATTDGAKFSTWTDRISSIAAAQSNSSLQPTYKTSQVNGKPVVRFDGTSYLPIATPGGLRTTVNSFDYTVMIVARCTGNTTSGAILSNTLLNGADNFMYVMDGTYVGQYSTMQTPYPVQNVITTFGTSSRSNTSNNALKHTYVNGGCVGADRGTGPTSNTTAFSIGGWSDGQYKVKADVTDVLVWNRNLTVAEVMQFQMWASERYGLQYPWANFDRIFVFDGDSLTAGIGATSRITTSYPAQMAWDMALPYGSWHNLGMSSQTMGFIDSVGQYRVDGIPAVTNKDVALMVTEWYNNGDKTPPAPYNAAISYLTNRKAASARIKTIFGTSTDSLADSSNETARSAYNSAFDSYVAGSHPLVDGYAPLHTNAFIGNTNSYSTYSGTYWADTVHFNDAGYAIQKAIFKTPLDSLMSGVPTPATPTLSRSTTNSNPRAVYVVTPTSHARDDVLRFKRTISSNTTYVDYVVQASDVGGAVTVSPWSYLDDGVYDVSVQHFHGGKGSANSSVNTANIASPQVVLTPNSLTAVQSGVNVVGGVTFTSVPITSGKRNLMVVHFYNNGSLPTRSNTTATIDGVNATIVAWAGIGSHNCALFLSDSAATHSSGSFVLSYPGEQAFVVDYASYAVDNFLGMVSETRSVGYGSSNRTDTFTVPGAAASIVVYSTTGSAPTWTWTGSTTGPNDGLIYVRHKNTGGSSETYTVGNGTGGQSCSFTLRSS